MQQTHTHFVYIYSANDSTKWGSFACNTQKYTHHTEQFHRIISKWIELTANPCKTMELPKIISNWNIICMHSIHSLFTHVIKSIANWICKQIFDKRPLFNEFDCCKREKIELRGFSSSLFFLFIEIVSCIANASAVNYTKFIPLYGKCDLKMWFIAPNADFNWILSQFCIDGHF